VSSSAFSITYQRNNKDIREQGSDGPSHSENDGPSHQYLNFGAYSTLQILNPPCHGTLELE